jgi:DMSO/TMAO reductase YedYZ molybdopterin-dependent catalytic subunit
MEQIKKRKQPAPAGHVWTRRSVVEWLGKGAAVALGADLLAACAGADDVVGPGAQVEPCDGGVGFPFEPSSDQIGIFYQWNERTVDHQDLASLLSDWELSIDGLVDGPQTLSFADLLQLERQDQVTDFHCVEGWSVHDVPWNGVHISTLLDLVEPQAGATHLTFYSSGDVYTESLPLEVAREPRTMLAYGVACNTLPLSHGFPLRVVVPRMFGYKSAKYVDRIEVTNEPIDGYWVKHGYSYEAEVPAHRLRPGKV